jgi:hypothetical protein
MNVLLLTLLFYKNLDCLFMKTKQKRDNDETNEILVDLLYRAS